MLKWTSETVAGILQAALSGDPDIPVGGCVLDSRQAKGGEIFFALPGEKTDGHAFIRKAWDHGAALAVARKDRVREFPEVLEVPAGKALVLVESPFQALQKLAATWRRELKAKVVGITGSNGKTTTKDMVSTVLGQRFRVHKNKQNNNNELGLPLTILNAPPDTEIMVLEMGMRGLGEIKALCQIARPDTGVITNIGTTHMELLGSQERIAAAKWELIEALPPGGIAVLNAEDYWSVSKAEAARLSGTRFYGLEGLYTVPAVQGKKLKQAGILSTSFEVSWQEEKAGAVLPLPGTHNVLDALAALAVGTVYGVPLSEGCQGLAELEMSKMRLEVMPGIENSVLINDVYNANPVSMQASLNILRERAGGRDTVAILGEMYELGELSLSGHREVGQTAAELGITELITVGRMAEEIARGALAAGFPEQRVHLSASKPEALRLARDVLARLKSPAWILIKASRGMKMEEITTGLQKEGFRDV